MKAVKVALVATLIVLLSGCGIFYERYRYPCQDPANWEAPECNPPVCKAMDVCWKDLIKYDEK